MRLFPLALMATLFWTAHAVAATNILLFMADDLHAESLETYGGKVIGLTPNLDKFAKSATVFQNGHVNVAICAPCRAVIATGLLSHNSGAMGFMPARPGTPTITSLLQKAGFNCGILGKVGHSTPVASDKWDYVFDQKDLGNGRSPALYYERSKVFFERCKQESKPFYFMVNSHDPHRPFCNPKKLTRGAEMPSQTYEPADVEVLGFVPDLAGVRDELAMYQNSTRRLDDSFGKVMEALEKSGFADNTLVIFITDNGIAIPFAKCNAWFHSTHTPMMFRLPGVIAEGKRDTTHFLSPVDFLPTFFELNDVATPERIDGRSLLPLLKGEAQADRDTVITQIDSKAGGAAVPMRCVQDTKFGYIYNPFSDGKYYYRNNNEGGTMAAMNKAAKTDPEIAKRVDLFRHRVPEEFYDLEKDPNCLHNLVDNPEYRSAIVKMQGQLRGWMVAHTDPMLPAFDNRNDRAQVDRVLEQVYGKPKVKKPKAPEKPRKKSTNK
ncbi:MAG: N-sulfoglucosamine sulfohydrolase [Rhodothermales bacterium]|jgi:N-sulfoglucosamine sulfohydrolase